jgi:hypothetical protein
MKVKQADKRQPSPRSLTEQQARLTGQIMAHPDADPTVIGLFNRLMRLLTDVASGIPVREIEWLKPNRRKASASSTKGAK